MLRSSLRLLSLTAALLLLGGCHRERCDTPIGEGGTFEVAQFAELGTVGGAVIINRGNRGICITRLTPSIFTAYECTCPHCHDVGVVLMADFSGLLECPVCGSRFETTYGQPIDGSETLCPLYEYSTSFDGNTLTIF